MARPSIHTTDSRRAAFTRLRAEVTSIISGKRARRRPARPSHRGAAAPPRTITPTEIAPDLTNSDYSQIQPEPPGYYDQTSPEDSAR